ncbi:target of EGR1 protein 1 [Lingula anatina]|uniref:Target of EGR1 protein 1 n=1 Tax=Lingula anatina TaxID=7574 RepID=A0A1S3JBI8_LINAN|nr:target of EGR1 protein 1 [Lingula anatina]|eukprot:XP_013407249.1 target of EGR1 protein 1 [Lingula anatina]
MADLSNVPVIDIHDDNFEEMWPSVVLALRTSTLVALDLELSGLGNRKMLTAKSIDDRYSALREVARTRSVLSVGISCFKQQPSNDLQVTFFVQTYNITLLCSEDYVVEPSSVQFLVDHGFDFNKQYSLGVSYYRGNDRAGDTKLRTVRQLISELILSRVPIAFHNGMVDLIYLYHSFYAELPSKLSTFLADLSEVFPAGIYDTKYITEFSARLQASFLEYAFRKCQRDNAFSASKEENYVHLQFPSYPSSFQNVKHKYIGLPGFKSVWTSEEKRKHASSICQVFAAHGWCPSLRKCQKSHNIDLILDCEEERRGKKRRRKRQKGQAASMEAERHTDDCDQSDANSADVDMESSHVLSKCTKSQKDGEFHNANEAVKQIHSSSVHNKDTLPSSKQDSPSSLTASHLEGGTPLSQSQSNSGGHRAGFDAFMTGFVLAKYVVQYGNTLHTDEVYKIGNFGMDSFANKLPLSGKDIPLQVTKSSFAKTSKNHQQKMELLQKHKESTT